jgi:hypothetical protein
MAVLKWACSVFLGAFMDCSKLNSTLDLLDAKINLLETSLGAPAHARKGQRNEDYFDKTKMPSARRYANDWVVNSGTRENNTAELFRVVGYVYSAFIQYNGTVGWPVMVGRMIYRNRDNINLYELRDRVSNDSSIDAGHRNTIAQVIGNIMGGTGAQYMPPVPDP